ncbi:MAG: glucose-1-phosphate adenylyltransferase subunit GlgD [Ruminococcaceae bacterium]|nr:glucose-1-phosphate adenylyltransferase subunit GlgD [Oscillospiraceae bacterium]
MEMSVTGIIFSNLHDNEISELTRVRTLASVPFGCRYRLIDFPLSNMVNSNISNINVITQYNYHSLMDHIGSGKDWDLARRSGGIKILPPYINSDASMRTNLSNTRLEALKSVGYSIAQMTSDYVVMADCNVICNIDFNDVLNDHIANGADVTIAVKRMNLDRAMAKANTLVFSSKEGRITDLLPNPTNYEGYADVSLNIIVLNRKYLQEFVLDSIAHGYSSITRDVFLKSLYARNFRIYRYEGYFACISSFDDYFTCNMQLIKNEELFNSFFGVEERPIFTKVRNSAPTYYSEDSKVENSLIADGCVIEGTVENSILFRGVKVGKGAVVKNSILFQDTIISEASSVAYTVCDKNVVIRNNVNISGHTTLPLYIDRGRMV